MTKKMSCYPPTVVLEDLSSLEDVSTCSSTSTITCSVWSSISNLDRSSIRQISSLTFSGMLDDDEFYSGRGGEEEDNGATVVHACSASEARRKSAKNIIDQAFGGNAKTTVDSLMLSERSLFQEPLSPIRQNDAPKAPARRQDDGFKTKKEDDLTPSRPLFTKSSSCPTRFGNTTSTTSATCLRAMNKSLSLRGVDSTPAKPARSNKDWNDDSSGLSLDNHTRDDDKFVEQRTPRARRKQLMKRIDNVQRMLVNNDDCNVMHGGVSLSRSQEEPPKLPRRGLFIDHSPTGVASSPRRNHQFQLGLHKKHDAKKDVSKSENESHANASNYNSSDKKFRRMASKFPPIKPRRKKRTARTPDQQGCEYNTPAKEKVEEATRETPPLLLSKVSKSVRDLRSRSKTPPKRSATAPAALRNTIDAEHYPLVPKRIIKRNRSSDHHRRRGQVLSNSSLASILESDDENFMASPINSFQRWPKRSPAVAAPVSCPSKIGILEAPEMSKKDKELRGVIGNKFLSRPQRPTQEHSWLGSGTRSLLL